MYNDLQGTSSKHVNFEALIHETKTYLLLASLIVMDSILLRSPNLFGKIGLMIYKDHYLRTFPKALLTVSIVVGVCALIAEFIRFTVKKRIAKRLLGAILLLLLTTLSVTLLVKTGMDFSAGIYSHTGLRFRFGACLLPAILVVVFVNALFTLPKAHPPPPKEV